MLRKEICEGDRQSERHNIEQRARQRQRYRDRQRQTDTESQPAIQANPSDGCVRQTFEAS